MRLRRPTELPQLTSSAYGYGLSVTQTCDFRAIVAHSGGLPGYGSVMRWLPDYGVGLIAFGNLTYTGWGRVVNDAIDALMRDVASGAPVNADTVFRIAPDRLNTAPRWATIYQCRLRRRICVWHRLRSSAD